MGSNRFLRVAFTSTLVLSGVTAFAQAPGLATRAGHEIGVAVSGYKYTEPSVMEVKATHVGIDYVGTFKLDETWFARAGLSYAAGKSNYSGTGTSDNDPQHVYEISAVLGKDLAMGDTTLSPYVGLGYRHLFHDFRGPTSTGVNFGYRRESTYLTLPLGVVHQMRLENQARLVSTVEYAHLIRGRQESRRSDVPGLVDVTNQQKSGRGIRLSMMYQQKAWSVGPFVTLWNIKDSDGVVVGALTIKEPANTTREFGVKAAYRF